MAGPNRTPKKATWQKAFLAVLKDTGNIRLACSRAGVARSTAYLHRTEDPAFRDAWDEALEEACDVLEAEARKRATVGGSDTLLIFLLKAHRPETYRDEKRLMHTGPDGGALQVEGSVDLRELTNDQLEQLVAIHASLAAAADGAGGAGPA